MFRFFHLGAAACALLLGSCSTPEIIPPEDVNSVIRSTAEARLPAAAWRSHLQQRTVQLVTWQPGGAEKVSPAGGGLAALISADGYALTAGHVVDHHFFGIPVLSGSGQPMAISLRGRVQYAGPVGDSRHHTPAGGRQIGLLHGRLVHRFSGDLALVKLPMRARAWFQLSETPPGMEDSLSMAWNPLVHARNPGSAGQVISVSRSGPGWRVESDAQMLLGDSGAAVIDSRGRLVGTFTAVRLVSGDGRKWDFERSMLEGLPAAVLEKRMAEDRATG